LGVRNRARKFLLQARYAAECNGDTVPANLDILGFSERFGPEEKLWLKALSDAVCDNRSSLDERISAVLENWTLERLSVLTRLVLEQASAEAFFLGIPSAVAINEAIDLSRSFEGNEAAAFVNGVLDKLLVAAGSAHGSGRRRRNAQEKQPGG
jgi:transcription antitermination protein NusB